MSRPALHVAAGLLALALRYLPPIAALALALVLVAHNVFVLPRYAPRLMRPPGPRADAGVVTYPIVVAGLVLLFHDRLHLAAAGWAILAFGDGAAAVVGRVLAGPRLPWNGAKRLGGSLAFVLAGAGTAALLGTFVAAGSPGSEWVSASAALPLAAAAALLASLAESLPSRLDDNIRVGIACAAAFWVGDGVDPSAVRAALDTAGQRIPLALAVQLVAGLAALRWQVVDVSGLAIGVLLGTLLWAFAGPAAFCPLVAFVAVGAAGTRLGRARKEALGLAQGRRGGAHALANLGVATFLALAGALHPGAPAWHLAMVAALATAAFDTGATEVGQAWGRRAHGIVGFQEVSPGTAGGVSLAGTLGGAAAALLVALVAVASGVLQGQDLFWVVVAAAIGSFAESCIAASPRLAAWLDHHARNVLNTSVGAGAAVLLARGVRG